MGLKAKFNLVMLAAFAVGLGLAGTFSYTIVRENARQEVLATARLILANALAIRNYTSTEIEPLLTEQSAVRFLPHTVPSWAAQTNFKRSGAAPDYAYKEASLNPTNPADRASDWEADLINTFQRDPAQKELVVERETPAGQTLNLSRPLRLPSQACLACHSVPSAAPVSMIDLYGPSNGFGWKMGDAIAAQIVSVPMAVAVEKANRLFLLFMGGLAAVFAVVLLVLNVLLHTMIVRPVRRMSAVASEVSLGNLETPEYEARGRDEIASLSQSFNRMRRSLSNAMTMLEAD